MITADFAHKQRMQYILLSLIPKVSLRPLRRVTIGSLYTLNVGQFFTLVRVYIITPRKNEAN